jgi:hypothetical protein
VVRGGASPYDAGVASLRGLDSLSF